MHTRRAISVVIPSYRDDIALASLLANLCEHQISEIIISDAELRLTPDFILDASKTSPIRYIHAPKGRGPQIKRGIEESQEDVIWVLHADSSPHPDSVKDIHGAMSDKTISLGCFPIHFSKTSPLLSCFAFFSKFDTSISSFGDQGFFFRRADYDKLDLDLLDFPLMEDVALRRELRSIGRVHKSKLRLETSARRFQNLGLLKTQAHNSSILFRYWCGENPTDLYQRYYGSIAQITQSRPPSSIARRV